MAKNKIVEGHYIDKILGVDKYGAFIFIVGFKNVYLNSNTVKNYHILTEEESNSLASGLTRGLVGNVLLGPIGLIAGGMSGKKISDNLIMIEFIDGQRSILDVDGYIKKAIMQKCFPLQASPIETPSANSEFSTCLNCRKQNNKYSKFCNECGEALQQSNNLTTESNEVSLDKEISSIPKPTSNFQSATPKKNNGCGCFLIAIVAIICFVFYMGSSNEEPSRITAKSLFDAPYYYSSSNSPTNQTGLIDRIGEPDSIDTWNYTSASGSIYEVDTYIYGNTEYHFNNNTLQRISMYDPISYTNKSDFLAMFKLSETSNSTVNDTNASFRVSNCGVLDFWIQYDDALKIITDVKISYGPLFL